MSKNKLDSFSLMLLDTLKEYWAIIFEIQVNLYQLDSMEIFKAKVGS